MTHHGDESSTDAERNEEAGQGSSPDLDTHPLDELLDPVLVGRVVGVVVRCLLKAVETARVHELLDKREKDRDDDRRLDHLAWFG